ncbi:MAG: HAMP domain-containing histidine kinase [Candidatus Latescibacteria bacterium]|nr:HAMP domain-containing histidine kinase [Candidatus Latescibacterota bacterium]
MVFNLIGRRLQSLGSPGAFKAYFIVVGAALTLAFLFDARATVRDLEENQREIIRSYGVYLITRVASTDLLEGEELSLVLNRIQEMDIPIVVTDIEGNPTAWKGVDIPQDPDDPVAISQIRDLIVEMDAEADPVPFDYSPDLRMLLHYQNPPAVRRMRWLPFVEIGIAGLFVFLSLFVYRNLKQMEQRYIWIGMARETAHQFGTPLSALMGWLELIRAELLPEGKDRRGTSRKIDNIIDEMNGDIDRLRRIASRFGQIGSVPELQKRDIREVIAESVDYFRKRVPQQGRSVEVRETYCMDGPLNMAINGELLAWVFENLLKNALDAIESDIGVISVVAKPSDDGSEISIIIEDNGKGIPAKAHRKVFDPGYTTKKRGWGLGLSLAKRIVEEYHRGKLLLNESRPGERTVFEIVLPISDR